jgi:hypothetical protein
VPPDDEVVIKAVEWFLNEQDENGNFVTNPQDVAGHGYTGTQARGALVTLCDWLKAVREAGREPYGPLTQTIRAHTWPG